MSRLRWRTFTMSTATRSVLVPNSAPWRATYATFALHISFLLGMQLMFGHEPPIHWRSTTAVCRPDRARSQASSFPPCPLPSTSASYRSGAAIRFLQTEGAFRLIPWLRCRRVPGPGSQPPRPLRGIRRERSYPSPRAGCSCQLLGQKVSDRRRDFACVGLECEMADVEEPYLSVAVVALERLRARRQEERVVLAPHRKQRGPVRAEVVLELRVQRDIAGVVAEQVQLDLVVAGPREQRRVERIASGATNDSSCTPCTYCHLVASGVKKSRSAARFLGVGSFQ